MLSCDKIDQSKALIDIHEYNILDIDEYGSELKKEYSLSDVQETTWIKTTNITSTPLLLTFKEKEPPRFKEIPREHADTKVYEYYEKPMSCKKCLKYGHTVKKYCEKIATCARCSKQGHNECKCTSAEVKCYHCEVDHQAFSKNCPKFKIETEIIQTQTNERMPRLQATQKLLKLNRNPESSFSNAVKNTPNPSRLKSPTSSEQESHSDSSSEDIHNID